MMHDPQSHFLRKSEKVILYFYANAGAQTYQKNLRCVMLTKNSFWVG